MKVCVTGSRDWVDYNRICDELDALHLKTRITALATGACRTGADAIAERWCFWRGVTCKQFRADWSQRGNAAGPIRNAKMLSDFKPDLVLAFKSKPISRGTDDCVDKAAALGIEVRVFMFQEK